MMDAAVTIPERLAHKLGGKYTQSRIRSDDSWPRSPALLLAAHGTEATNETLLRDTN
jgi:hypothetical protein